MRLSSAINHREQAAQSEVKHEDNLPWRALQETRPLQYAPHNPQKPLKNQGMAVGEKYQNKG